MNGLRNLGDQLKEKLGEGVVVIASVLDGKVNLMAACATDEAHEEGRSCRKPHQRRSQAIVGGGGGGRPNMAQAGGKKPERSLRTHSQRLRKSFLSR